MVINHLPPSLFFFFFFCYIYLTTVASPTQGPEHGRGEHTTAEEQPLLGAAGVGVGSAEGTPLVYNFIQGTAALAQVGVLVLVAIVFAHVFSHPVIIFDFHPIVNSLGILLTVQAILVLQPTGFYDIVQKKKVSELNRCIVWLVGWLVELKEFGH